MDEAQLGLFYVLTVSWGETPVTRSIYGLWAAPLVAVFLSVSRFYCGLGLLVRVSLFGDEQQ